MYTGSGGEDMKRWAFKTVLSVLLYYSGALWVFARLKRVLGKTSITILTYHSVTDEFNYLELFMALDKFHGQVRYLAGLGSVISMQDAENLIRSGRRPEKDLFVLTFDDGYKDNYLNAYPILKKYEVPGIIYLTTGCLNSSKPPFAYTLVVALHYTKKTVLDLTAYGLGTFSVKAHSDWENVIRMIDRHSKPLVGADRLKFQAAILEQLGFRGDEDIFKNRMLSWDEVRAMTDRVAYGGHTLTHPVLAACSPETARTEIEQCKKEIEQVTRQSVRSFAYPYGGKDDLNDGIIGVVQKAGYGSAVVLYRNPHRPENMFKLGRIMVSNAMTSRFFDNKFSRAMFACEMSGLFDILFRRK